VPVKFRAGPAASALVIPGWVLAARLHCTLMLLRA
jgi:hypothetical protein